MIKKSLFLDLGGFDESMRTCEDYDLSLRLACKNKIELIKNPLVTKFGGHEDQLSKKYHIMDKYRIYALEKILSSNCLTQEQIESVTLELTQKKEIIHKGFVKRNNAPSCRSNL